MLFKFNWLLVFAGLITLAGTAQAQDVPTVISPLQSVTDPNGVNLLTGKVVMQMPVLSVPGDPHLRFDRVQNAAPYTVGKVFTGDPRTETYSVVKADGTSDSFRCVDYDCTDITGAGSQYLPNSNVYTEAGTGTVYHFSDQSVVLTARYSTAGMVSTPMVQVEGFNLIEAIVS